ncbi:MAG: Holliday junction branch migration protein RuvA [Gammaproteobacteria bacterium]|nr:Holliday junction branch migration protein RuvA [Gammaproteobacteria bacterium]
MIGSLRGTVAMKQAPQVVVECGGVGYVLDTPMSTFLSLPAVGANVFLFTHMVVREDSQTLYGFMSDQERGLFRLLLKVSGVGAKMGLAILSGMSVTDFQRCVTYEDTAMLVKIPGVGKKTAERLIIEMRDKIEQSGRSNGHSASPQTLAAPQSEAADALVALGYKPAEVTRLLKQLDLDGLSTEDIIRQALKQAVG